MLLLELNFLRTQNLATVYTCDVPRSGKAMEMQHRRGRFAARLLYKGASEHFAAERHNSWQWPVSSEYAWNATVLFYWDAGEKDAHHAYALKSPVQDWVRRIQAPGQLGEPDTLYQKLNGNAVQVVSCSYT